jgi:hypothetical protein
VATDVLVAAGALHRSQASDAPERARVRQRKVSTMKRAIAKFVVLSLIRRHKRHS